MSKRKTATISDAGNTADYDVTLDTSNTDDLSLGMDTPTYPTVDASNLLPSPALAVPASIADALDLLRVDEPAITLAAVLSDADSSAVALITAANADTTATTVSAAITSNRARADIANHVIKLMQRRNIGIASASVHIFVTMERHYTLRGERMPAALRNIVNWDHALKCWIAGMCDSSELPVQWTALKKRPFWRVNDRIMRSYLANKPGYDSQCISDFMSRIAPSHLVDSVLDAYDQCTNRIERFTYLRAFFYAD